MKHKTACEVNGSSTDHYIPALIKMFSAAFTTASPCYLF